MLPSSTALSHTRAQQWHCLKGCHRSVRAAVAPAQHTDPGSSSISDSFASASSITKRIKQASSTTELLQLHAAHRDRLDAIHYAALFNRLLHPADAAQPGSISQTHTYRQTPHEQQQYKHGFEQQHGLILHHHHLQQQQHDTHRQLLLQALLADLPSSIPTLQPGPLVVVLRSLAKLNVHPQPQLLLALLHHAHRILGFDTFGPRELCTLAHALTEFQPVPIPWRTPAAAAAAAGDARLASSQQQPQQQQHQHQHQQQQVGNTVQQDRQSSGSSSSGSSSSWDPLLLRDMFYALGRSLPHCNAQDAAQAILAVTKLHWRPPEAWLRMWLLRSTQLLPNFSPQGLANAAYGLVRVLQLLGQVPSSNSSSSRQDWAQRGSSGQHQQQERQHASPPDQQQPQQHQQQEQQGTLLQAAHTWLRSCLSVSALHLHTLKPQELIGQLLWAAGKVTCTLPEPTMHRLLTAAEEMLPFCDARHLCAALYAFTLVNHSPDRATSRVLWASLVQQGLDLSPRDLSEVLWAAGQLQLQPPAAVRLLLQQQALLLLGGQPQQDPSAAAAAAQMQGSASQRQGSATYRVSISHPATHPRHVVGVLRGMVGLGWQLQEKYVVRLQTVLLEQLESCSPQDISNTLWALATAGVQVETRWLDRVLMAASSRLDQFNPQELSNTLWALAQLQHTPSNPWMQQLLLASLQQMSSFLAADFTQTLGGLSKLGYNPSPLWLSSFWSKSGQSLIGSNFSAAELHTLLLAAVKLEVQPPQRWVQVAAGAVERGLAGFGSQQLLEVLRALQQLAQAGDNTAATAAAAAAASAGVKHAVVFVGSSSSGMVAAGGSSRVSSCIVPISSSSSRGGVRGSSLQWQLQQLEQGADLPPGHSANSSSSKVLKVKHPPGLVRLRRQVYHSRATVAGKSLLRPVWPPTSHHSISAAAAAFTSHHSSSGSIFGSLSCAGSEGSMGTIAAQQQQQLQLWGSTSSTSSTADEMYSLACLVQLMPQQRRVRLERWPQWLAAERAQGRESWLQVQGLRRDRLIAAQ